MTSFELHTTTIWKLRTIIQCCLPYTSYFLHCFFKPHLCCLIFLSRMECHNIYCKRQFPASSWRLLLVTWLTPDYYSRWPALSHLYQICREVGINGGDPDWGQGGSPDTAHMSLLLIRLIFNCWWLDSRRLQASGPSLSLYSDWSAWTQTTDMWADKQFRNLIPCQGKGQCRTFQCHIWKKCSNYIPWKVIIMKCKYELQTSTLVKKI